VSKETISRITDKVIEEMIDWAVRPLDEFYAAIFIDAIVVKVRDGQVGNRPFYAAIGVSLAGERDILGLWAGTGGEGYGTSTGFVSADWCCCLRFSHLLACR
jgi:putative transposase